jgi:16S rRNA (adenine1518-N6/adenine1519-N6)-dimethyltransferase
MASISGDDAGGRRRPPPIRKNLGQHFLSDPRILERIADTLELTGAETVLEIGPGRGGLTEALRPHARRLVAIEYDRALAAQLRDRFASAPNIEIVQADVLEANLAEIARGEFHLIGNVPYYITTPIIFHALEAPRPKRAVYLVQREVADRLAAAPGSDDYGALSANVQAVAQVERLFKIPAGAFHPPPKVESAVVRITPLEQSVVTPSEEAPFRELVQRAFSMRRKQLRRVLRELYAIDAPAADDLIATAALAPEQRPETLSPDDFARILRAASSQRLTLAVSR